MDFKTIKDEFFERFSFDSQLLHNKDGKRPYLVILELKYSDDLHKFAIPFRSNIPNYINKSLYCSLPPRKTTKSEHVHGLHFIKMFPVKNKYLKPFIGSDENSKIIKNYN